MEVIARIPRLHDAAGMDVEQPSTTAAEVLRRPVEADVASSERPEPAATTEACGPQPPPAAGRPPAGRKAGERRAGAALFSPSILVLATMAAVVWAAAWRNERLRALEQRAARVAMEPPAMAGPDRSLTP